MSLSMPTMTDIAKECGVSAMTVSYVLNRKGNISDATRKKVISVVEQMGYAFNPHASQLSKLKGSRRNITRNVGCVLGEAANKYSDPYFGEIVETIEKELISRGFHMMFVHAWNELKDDPLLRASLLSRNIIDGIVAIGLPSSAFIQLQASIDVMVAVDSESPDEIDSISSDHYSGGYEATKYLLDNGHKRVVYIGHQFEETGTDRFEGYTSALREREIKPLDELIVHAPLSMQGGLEAITSIVNNGTAFSAVFTHNDAMACGVIKGLRRGNISVPKDVSVVGYNNDFISELIEPELTTVSVDKRSLGQLAASEIIERVEGRYVPARKQVLPVRLIVRETTAPYKPRL